MRVKLRRSALSLLLCAALALSGAGSTARCTPKAFGVFLGVPAQEARRLCGYDTLVVDAQDFAAADLAALHAHGSRTVYSYLNIGSVETWRACWPAFCADTLGPYENWPDECWMDVSQPAWQAYLTDAAAKLAAKGADGFFLDNADVYSHCRTPAVYDGLLRILRQLHALGRPLILNGGGDFVREALRRGDLTGLLQGAAQESVFTTIRFPGGVCTAQDADVTADLQRYLAVCRQAGLAVYLIEYAPDARLRAQIGAYCRANGFAWYAARSAALD